MTITYPRALPAELVIQYCSVKLDSAVGVARSGFSFSEQVHAFSGQRFGFDITAAPTTKDDGAIVAGWFASMNGREKTILFGDPMRTTARGSAGTTPGAPKVKGASQTGASLLCDDVALTSVTGYLKVGDYIQLGATSLSRLHMVLEDVNIDSGGNYKLRP